METGSKGERHQDKKIDDAIKDTFPASDPMATGKATSTEPAQRPADRKAPIISKEEIEQAKRGNGHAQNDSIKRSG